MGFMDLFTGAGEARAEKTGRKLLADQQNRNEGDLLTGYGQAANYTTQGRDDAINTLTGARDAASGYINTGATDAYDYLKQGVQGAQNAYGGARDAFGSAGDAYGGVEAIAARNSPANTLYLDALGLNGQEGAGRAQESYGNALTNDFALNQTLEAINRAAAARGGGEVRGGNIDRATTQYAADYIGQNTNSYLDRLLGLSDRGDAATGTAAAGRAGSANNIGNTYLSEAGTLNNYGINQANVAQSTADRLAGLASGTGGAVAGLQGSAADRLANLALGQTNANIGLRNNYTQNINRSLGAEAGARSQGNANLLSTGLKAAEMAAGLAAGGLPGLGSLGSLLGPAAASGAPMALANTAKAANPFIQGSLY